jgi:hypothetical protein
LNLQCFLIALDILASFGAEELPATLDPATKRHLLALREMSRAMRTQRQAMENLGWKIVTIPSLPDLYRTINYLNGVHDRTRYLMPAFGGFYAFLDQAAAEAIRNAFGSEVQIVPIFCAISQAEHGAVHCAASVYPQL